MFVCLIMFMNFFIFSCLCMEQNKPEYNPENPEHRNRLISNLRLRLNPKEQPRKPSDIGINSPTDSMTSERKIQGQSLYVAALLRANNNTQTPTDAPAALSTALPKDGLINPQAQSLATSPRKEETANELDDLADQIGSTMLTIGSDTFLALLGNDREKFEQKVASSRKLTDALESSRDTISQNTSSSDKLGKTSSIHSSTDEVSTNKPINITSEGGLDNKPQAHNFFFSRVSCPNNLGQEKQQ